MNIGDEVFDIVENKLRRNCPSPEKDITKLSLIAAQLPETEEGARIRLLVIDIDDLIAQTRWHLGQALLLMETQPHILNREESTDPIEKLMRENEWPANALLLLRGYIRDADKVLFADLSESRKSGTVAGWIFHMMIDSAIFRMVSALDRLAHILWFAARLPAKSPKGELAKIYFRSKKLEQIHQAINNYRSQKLVDLAKGPLLKFVIDYRDNLTHEMKSYSKIAGSRPTEEWTTTDGIRYLIKNPEWDAEMLFAFGNATYHQLLEALGETTLICDEKYSTGSL